MRRAERQYAVNMTVFAGVPAGFRQAPHNAKTTGFGQTPCVAVGRWAQTDNGGAIQMGKSPGQPAVSHAGGQPRGSAERGAIELPHLAPAGREQGAGQHGRRVGCGVGPKIAAVSGSRPALAWSNFTGDAVAIDKAFSSPNGWRLKLLC